MKLAVDRARATGAAAIFWLDESRAYDRNLIAKVAAVPEGPRHDGARHPDPVAGRGDARDARSASAQGEDTISVTGNVLRDYLTDLFPILELGTSAKMLSIVPLLAGGGLYETGAGGSAPKHVQQFVQENYLRWDSLGEFLALAVSLEDLGTQDRQREGAGAGRDARPGERQVPRERQVAAAQGRRARQPRQPLLSRDVLGAGAGRPDEGRRRCRRRFAPVAEALERERGEDRRRARGVQGKPVDIGGYYHPDAKPDAAAMRPSATLNAIIDAHGVSFRRRAHRAGETARGVNQAKRRV